MSPFSGFSVGLLALAGLGASSTHAQQTADREDLRAIVDRQAQEIEQLKQRLSALEARAPSSSDVGAGTTAEPEGSAARTPTLARWGAGAAPTLTSADGAFTFHPRGRILLDISETSGSRFNQRNYATTGARSLRLGADGTVSHSIGYVFEADFSQDTVNVLNAYIGWRSSDRRPVRYEVRAGNVFLDRGVESSTGPDNVPFLDRNTVGTTIAPLAGFYGLGVIGFASGANWHVSASATGDDVDGKTASRDTWVQQVRAHWDPLHNERTFVHLGLWGFHETISPTVVDAGRISQIGGRFNTMLRIQSGPITDARASDGFGGEIGGGIGSLWVMGEAGRRIIDRRGATNPEATAWSISSGLFLTGEPPEYSSRFGTFVHPKVIKSVFEGGMGAVELTARYERLDYANLATGGSGWAATAGANWYLNPFIRLMVNYIHWDSTSRVAPFEGHDNGDTVSARAQLTF